MPLLAVFAEKPNYIVAHNAQIEKNLIREYLPYPKYEERDGSLHTADWGPWLDTLTAYRTLYPSIKDYSLEHLTATFVENGELNALVKSLLCRGEKAKLTSLCTMPFALFMLAKRIAKLGRFGGFHRIRRHSLTINHPQDHLKNHLGVPVRPRKHFLPRPGKHLFRIQSSSSSRVPKFPRPTQRLPKCL